MPACDILCLFGSSRTSAPVADAHFMIDPFLLPQKTTAPSAEAAKHVTERCNRRVCLKAAASMEAGRRAAMDRCSVPLDAIYVRRPASEGV